MLLVFTAYCVFAKDQVFNAIDYLNSLMPTNIINTNVIENTEVLSNDIEEAEVIEEENIEEIDPIQEYYNQVDKIVSSEDDQNSKAEELRNILSEVMQKNEETDDELVQYISQTIMDLTINTEQSQNEENDENNLKDDILVLIANPNLPSPTKIAYDGLKLTETNKSLTKNSKIAKLVNEIEKSGSLKKLGPLMYNKLERSVFRYLTEVRLLKEKLQNLGAEVALMSGSGSSVFALVEDEIKAQKIRATLKQQGYIVFVTRFWRAIHENN